VIRPEQEHIDAVISECRKPIIVSGEGFAFEAVGYHESVIAALADDLDAMRAAQADAIKAAVDKERERCRGWWSWFNAALLNPDEVDVHQRTGEGIRSGADAPGAVPRKIRTSSGLAVDDHVCLCEPACTPSEMDEDGLLGGEFEVGIDNDDRDKS